MPTKKSAYKHKKTSEEIESENENVKEILRCLLSETNINTMKTASLVRSIDEVTEQMRLMKRCLSIKNSINSKVNADFPPTDKSTKKTKK